MSSDNLAPPPAVGESQPAPAAKTRRKATGNYRAKVWALHHPYQNLKVPVSGSVTLVNDSWVESQIAAGTIIKV